MASKEDVQAESDSELVDWGLSIESGLSDWEIEFLEDMKKLTSSGAKLTKGRRAKLEEIVEEKG